MPSTNLKSAGTADKRSKPKTNGSIVTRYQRQPDSVPSQLEALAVGDSYARGARIEISEFMQSEANEWLTKVTRVLSMQVARTTESNPKRKYSIERLQGMAHSGDALLCSIIVTRTA